MERIVQNESKDDLKLRNEEQNTVLNSYKLKYACDDNLMSMQYLHKSLACVDENPVKPCAFLMEINASFQISIAPTADSATIPNITDIDIQLKTLSRRIQLNKSLLEQINDRLRKFNSSSEKHIKCKMNDGDHKSAPEGANCSSIDEMQQILEFAINTSAKMNDLVNDESKII